MKRTIIIETIISAICGSMTALAFSSARLYPLVFFTLAPLFFLLTKTRCPFRVMFSYGFFLYACTTLWLTNTTEFLPLPKAVGLPLIFIGIIFFSAVQAAALSLPFLFFHHLRRGGITDAFFFSSLYALGEFMQEYIPIFAFPWARLCNIVSPFTEFTQSASLFGGLFVSFLVSLLNGLLCLIVSYAHRMKKVNLPAAILAVAVFSANIIFGTARISNSNETPDATAILVQGNFSGTDKRYNDTDEMILRHISLAEGCNADADMVVFSETSLPEYLGEKLRAEEKILGLARKKNCPVITGALHKADEKRYNAMAVFYTDGRISEPYLKRKIVPFGEYLPLREILVGIFPTLERYGGFSAGAEAVSLPVGEHIVGGVICFESIFPEIVRSTVRNGAEVIVVISNDSWFGEGSALYQHHSHAVIRAVENGRYTLRSSSTAVTSCISPAGKIKATAEPFEPVAVAVNFSYLNTVTLYSRLGNVIVIPFSVVFIFSVISYFRRRNAV